jgi:TrmH family RNA methyltransferase
MNLSKAKAAWISSLQIKKFRLKNHKFVVEGDKIVQELLRAPGWEVAELYALPTWIASHKNLLPGEGMLIVPVSEEELKKISAHPTPNQAVAVATPREMNPRPEVLRSDLSLFLDGIQDPGNLGAILRIADWFGIGHVFLGPGTVDLFNPKVIQASMGAFLRLCVQERELADLREEYPGLILAGADLAGQDVFAYQRPSAAGLLLVIGNEGGGISEGNRSLLDAYLTIPAAKGGGAESLNAAVAAGILCAVLRHGGGLTSV